MKNVLKISFFYLCLLLCICCSKKSGEGIPEDTATKGAEEGVPKDTARGPVEGIPENSCDYLASVAYTGANGTLYNQTYFTYDKSGRVTSVKSDGHNQSTFVYSKSSIMVDVVNTNGEHSTSTYNLDANGRIISTSDYKYNCKYDAEGYLISFDRPTWGDSYVTMRFAYKDGNLVKIITPETNIGLRVSDITYYDKPAQSCSGLNTPLSLTGFFGREDAILAYGGYYGKPSKNLLKEVLIDSENSYFLILRSYDAKGRLSSTNGMVYTYQCD